MQLNSAPSVTDNQLMRRKTLFIGGFLVAVSILFCSVGWAITYSTKTSYVLITVYSGIAQIFRSGCVLCLGGIGLGILGLRLWTRLRLTIYCLVAVGIAVVGFIPFVSSPQTLDQVVMGDKTFYLQLSDLNDAYYSLYACDSVGFSCERVYMSDFRSYYSPDARLQVDSDLHAIRVSLRGLILYSYFAE